MGQGLKMAEHKDIFWYLTCSLTCSTKLVQTIQFSNAG